MQIWAAFHPEPGVSLCGDKFHQLRFFIHLFNQMLQFFWLRQECLPWWRNSVNTNQVLSCKAYNKDKSDMYKVDFSIWTDSTHYFIYYLDINQRKNIDNIDTHEDAHVLPTTQKAVMNTIWCQELIMTIMGLSIYLWTINNVPPHEPKPKLESFNWWPASANCEYYGTEGEGEMKL